MVRSQAAIMMRRMVKPLNVLVMTDSKPLFKSVQTSLAAVVNPNKYLVYHLDPTSSPFQPSVADTAVLVVAAASSSDVSHDKTSAFLEQSRSNSVLEEQLELHLQDRGFERELTNPRTRRG